MQILVTFLWILLVAIPVFALFKLLRSLEENKVDESAKEKFYEALCEQYGRPSPKATKTEPEVQKPKRALTEEERIALARRLSDDPFAEITASDIISESHEDEKNTEPAADIKEENMTAVQQTETVQTASDSEKEQAENKKMSRDEALAMVSNILGNSKSSSKGRKKNKGKGDAYFELQATLNKYKKD